VADDDDDDNLYMNYEDLELQLFAEPDNFYKQPADAVITTYQRTHNRELVEIRLLGKHPLWGHRLWNAAIVLADAIDKNMLAGECLISVANKRVLELGAGAALPSLISLLNGCSPCVVTDYPDTELIENIKYNVQRLLEKQPELQSRAIVEGHLWGKEISKLLAAAGGNRFDVILLADLIFNHISHTALLETCSQCLAVNGEILVAFSHHKPRLAADDLRFFELAAKPPFFLRSTRLYDRQCTPMWEQDEGPADVRGLVQVFRMTFHQPA